MCTSFMFTHKESTAVEKKAGGSQTAKHIGD